MTFTAKNQAQLERWNRIAQMRDNGDVMTSSRRTRLENQRRKAQKLQDQAEAFIASLNASQIASNRYSDISTTPIVKEAVPVANTYLSANQKEDRLAAQASRLLKEILAEG